MKLDKIAFAQVIAYITQHVGSMPSGVVEDLDTMIDVVFPLPIPEPVVVPRASCTDVDTLLYLIKEGTKKIEAIKAYRVLTGAGLKESKDAVERYLPSSEYRTAKQIKVDMVDSIDRQLNNPDAQHFVLQGFNSADLVTVRKFVESFSEHKF